MRWGSEGSYRSGSESRPASIRSNLILVLLGNVAYNQHMTRDEAEQLALPGILDGETRDYSAQKNGGRSTFSDPAFADNKSQPVHRWVPWIAGFSAAFVRDALKRYMLDTGTVLDPFAGVATTLVEAMLAGHNAIGFEINPYAALAGQVKTRVHHVNVRAFRQAITDFWYDFNEKVASDYAPKSKPPEGFKTRTPFYSPPVLRKVLLVRDYIASLEDGDIRDLFRLAFAATMINYSNYSYEPSLSRRVTAGKQEIHNFQVGVEIAGKLQEMLADISLLQKTAPNSVTAKVINASFFDYADHLEPATVSLIITSPPYLNNYHYNRNTRPQLYWLGFVEGPSDMQPLEQANFGKYWQTVRGGERLDLSFSLPGSDLPEKLDALRQINPEKGLYGGSGWANYAASYFNDCYRFAHGIKYALEPGGTALVVIGNSILQGIQFPTDLYFGAIAESVGLKLIDIHVPRATRVGNSIIQSDVRVAKARDSQQLYEAVVEVRKG